MQSFTTKAGLLPVLFLLCFAVLTVQAQVQNTANDAGLIRITGNDGKVRLLGPDDDDDGDGIINRLEVNGFTYSILDGLQEWNGDPAVKHFITDPLSWSSDQDPYSDLNEASGVNMPPSILAPENHPLVAARPKISIKMENYEVVILEEITTSEGGYSDSSFTNEVTNENTVGGSVTVEAELNPFKLVGGSVEASYSHTWANTNSSTSSWGSDWNNARTTKPDQAARLVLHLYMENTGSAAAGNVKPTFNLKLGERTIKTVALTEADESPLQLAPGERFPKSPETLTIGDDPGSEIYITLDDLKAIQAGAPLSMVVIQVSGDVMRWNSSNQSWETYLDWSGYENPIDEVTVQLLADLGDNEVYRYQVYAGTEFWDPGFKMRDILSFVFKVENRADGEYIAGRKYPDKWFFSSPSPRLIDEYNNNQPENMLDLRMFKKTKLALFSPGTDPKPVINLAAYTPDFDNVWVSARPNNFPIRSVKAVVEINGAQQEVELTLDKRGFYSYPGGFADRPEPGGLVRVTNAANEVVERKLITPAIYASAADVKKYSFAQPVPNGEYFIALGGDPEKLAALYCLFNDPLNGRELPTPREYLSLAAEDSASNFVDMIADRDWVRYYFHKIRINPSTLAIYDDDNTFVTEDTVAMDCYECLFSILPVRYGITKVQYPMIGFDSVYANINLTGTAFKVDTSKITLNYEEGILTTDGTGKVFDFFSSSDYPGYYAFDFQYGWEGDSLYLVFEPAPKVTGLLSGASGSLPSRFALEQNYPNPFNPATTIRFTLPERADVMLSIYNMRGQRVAEVLNARNLAAGKREVIWNGLDYSGRRVASGVYIYRIEATGTSGKRYSLAKRMMLIK